MSAPAAAAPRPVAMPPLDGCIRPYKLAESARWRAEVDGAWGTVTEFHMLGGVITSYRVEMDRGDAHHFWAASVLAGPVPTGRPHLVCLPGGRA